MSDPRAIDELARALREICLRDPGQAEPAISAFLEEELSGYGPEERLAALEALRLVFPVPEQDASDGVSRLIPMLLGKDHEGGDLSDPETLGRLAQSMSVLFSTLNDLISLINSTLGGGAAGDETIRHIIGSSLQGEGGVRPIEEYLSQIRKAFLVAQQSSKEAARTIAGHILAELDPRKLEPAGKGFLLGPLKKAEAFEAFAEKYGRVMKWYESERFLTDFLRQFEKNCQKSFT
jgi:hypothetical protein